MQILVLYSVMGLWKHNYENLCRPRRGRDRKAGSKMEKKEKEPRGFYVEKGSFFAHAAVIVLVFSIAARLLGTIGLWGDMTQLLIQVLLPVGSALLGKKKGDKIKVQTPSGKTITMKVVSTQYKKESK